MKIKELFDKSVNKNGVHSDGLIESPETKGAEAQGAALWELKKYDPRQPRNDLGQWSDGAGGISVGHAVHVMRSEGISEEHHGAVVAKIKDGTHKTREQVLAHIDAIHAGGKGVSAKPKGVAPHEVRANLAEIEEGFQKAIKGDKEKMAELNSHLKQISDDITGTRKDMLDRGCSVEEFKEVLGPKKDQYQIASDELHEIYKANRAQQSAARLAAHDALFSTIPDTGNPLRVVAHTPLDTPRQEAVSEGTAFVNRMAGGLMGESLLCTVAKAGQTRAHYTSGAGKVSLSPQDGARVMVHELGHLIEDKFPHILDKLVEFHQSRTAGEPEISLKKATGANYRSSEKTRKDNYIHPYMGKEYRHKNGTHHATEILSMGLEYLHSEPLVLAKKDPQFFDFIVGLLQGK